MFLDRRFGARACRPFEHMFDRREGGYKCDGCASPLKPKSGLSKPPWPQTSSELVMFDQVADFTKPLFAERLQRR
jgi:hypothetical protein